MDKPNVIDFNACKSRVELSKKVNRGIEAYAHLLDSCEAAAAQGTLNTLLVDSDEFHRLQALIANFYLSINVINAGIDYLARHEFIEEVTAIERLNTRADVAYARLYKLYSSALIAKQGDSNVVVVLDRK